MALSVVVVVVDWGVIGLRGEKEAVIGRRREAMKNRFCNIMMTKAGCFRLLLLCYMRLIFKI